MQYAMLIHEKPGYVEALAEDEQRAVLAEYTALAEDPRARAARSCSRSRPLRRCACKTAGR
jgi:hypothetical protein